MILLKLIIGYHLLIFSFIQFSFASASKAKENENENNMDLILELLSSNVAPLSFEEEFYRSLEEINKMIDHPHYELKFDPLRSEEEILFFEFVSDISLLLVNTFPLESSDIKKIKIFRLAFIQFLKDIIGNSIPKRIDYFNRRQIQDHLLKLIENKNKYAYLSNFLYQLEKSEFIFFYNGNNKAFKVYIQPFIKKLEMNELISTFNKISPQMKSSLIFNDEFQVILEIDLMNEEKVLRFFQKALSYNYFKAEFKKMLISFIETTNSSILDHFINDAYSFLDLLKLYFYFINFLIDFNVMDIEINLKKNSSTNKDRYLNIVFGEAFKDIGHFCHFSFGKQFEFFYSKNGKPIHPNQFSSSYVWKGNEIDRWGFSIQWNSHIEEYELLKNIGIQPLMQKILWLKNKMDFYLSLTQFLKKDTPIKNTIKLTECFKNQATLIALLSSESGVEYLDLINFSEKNIPTAQALNLKHILENNFDILFDPKNYLITFTIKHY